MCWLPPDGEGVNEQVENKQIKTETGDAAPSTSEGIYSACFWIQQMKFHVHALITRIVSNMRTLV